MSMASGEQSSPATRSAQVLVQTLADLGVCHVVLAPGSRSAPLAYALAEAALPVDHPDRDPAAPLVDLHVRVDERVAAFVGLGLARAHRARRAADVGAPVAVITTSGSAVAHLLPAVLEASHAKVPLLLITADRPHELRGTGANQTTEQTGLLEPAVRRTFDVPAPVGRPGEDRDLRHLLARAVAAATGARTGDPGPAHVNLAFREPFIPQGEPWPVASRDGLSVVVSRSPVANRPPDPVLTSPIGDTTATVVVAGDGAGADAAALAEANRWPLLAEPSSDVRGASALPAYRLLLDHPELGGQIRRAVVLGRPTLSRPVQALLARDDVEVIVVAPNGRDWPDAARNATEVLSEAPALMLRGGTAGPQEWFDRWHAASRAALTAIGDVLQAEPDEPAPGPAVAAAVAGATGSGDVLVVAASNSIRDLDLIADWHEPPTVIANRGLAGIDGILSTATGLALALDRPVRALVGDLAFLHDVGGLLVGPTERRPDLQVVVANDDGGSIFATLEHGAPELAHLAERVTLTPHGADLAGLCAGYAVPHRQVTVAELPTALAEPVRGTSVLEVAVDRTRRRALTERLAEAARHAVDAALADRQP